jgi:hypothetical protein
MTTTTGNKKGKRKIKVGRTTTLFIQPWTEDEI